MGQAPGVEATEGRVRSTRREGPAGPFSPRAHTALHLTAEPTVTSYEMGGINLKTVQLRT